MAAKGQSWMGASVQLCLLFLFIFLFGCVQVPTMVNPIVFSSNAPSNALSDVGVGCPATTIRIPTGWPSHIVNGLNVSTQFFGESVPDSSCYYLLYTPPPCSTAASVLPIPAKKPDLTDIKTNPEVGTHLKGFDALRVLSSHDIGFVNGKNFTEYHLSATPSIPDGCVAPVWALRLMTNKMISGDVNISVGGKDVS